jgi:cyclohexanone monooxygenase
LTNFDTIIIGAGFSGLYQLHRCRDDLNLKTLVIEEGSDLGGTWYWNTYPGARCDSESHTYGYTFSENIYKNWTWNEKYPKQSTILKYLNYVEKKLNLRKNILFNHKIISAKYLERKNLWQIKTNKKKVLFCKYLICAVGSLSAANIPKIKGIKYV